MPAIRLGKNHLRWCMECNLPVMESAKCPICEKDTVMTELTPPADSRPAFDHDIELVRSTIDAQFGEGTGLAVIPEGHIVIMNKCPAIDRMEEVLCDGVVVGTMRYDIGKGWQFIIRLQGAYRLKGKISKNYVVCDAGAVRFLQESKNLMAPGIVDCCPGLNDGDEIIIVDPEGNVIATGPAKMTSEDMLAHVKGVGVKTRWYKPEVPIVSDKAYTWEQVVEYNRPVIEKRVSEASNFIHITMEKYKDLPAVVSFSGGKDSLATLMLTRDAQVDLPAMFVDTGLEFNETVAHVHEVCEKYNIRLIEEKAPVDAFFGNLVQFGPPAKDYRWCCKTNKLGPMVNAINKNFPDGVLSFIGQRKYESEARNSKPRVWQNPWTPGQIGASPIQSWSAMHIWLYLFSRNVPYNVWYTRGLDRIGCFLCPASDLAEFDVVKAADRYPQWDSFLDEYAKNNSLPSEWKDYGLWRWKSAPQSIKDEIARVTGREVPDCRRQVSDDGPITIRVQEGYSPCTMGYSIEAALSKPIDLEKVYPFSNCLAWQIDLNKDENYMEAGFLTIYGDGAMISKANNEMDARNHIDEGFQVIMRALQCVGCGLCAARCRPHALYMKDGKVQVDPNECIFCRECFGPCPSAKFASGSEPFES